MILNLFISATMQYLQDAGHRRPYESLLLCCSEAAPEPWSALGAAPPPDNLVILSVPTEHSRKPHLGALLNDYLPPNAKCLEVSTVNCSLLFFAMIVGPRRWLADMRSLPKLAMRPSLRLVVH